MYLLALLASLFCLLFISTVISDTSEPHFLAVPEEFLDSNEEFSNEHFVRRAPAEFLRFGRQPVAAAGTPLASASFLRFGRSVPPAFLRFGRGNTNAAGFLRFGRQSPSTGSNAFLRFGRRSEA